MLRRVVCRVYLRRKLTLRYEVQVILRENWLLVSVRVVSRLKDGVNEEDTCTKQLAVMPSIDPILGRYTFINFHTFGDAG